MWLLDGFVNVAAAIAAVVGLQAVLEPSVGICHSRVTLSEIGT